MIHVSFLIPLDLHLGSLNQWGFSMPFKVFREFALGGHPHILSTVFSCNLFQQVSYFWRLKRYQNEHWSLGSGVPTQFGRNSRLFQEVSHHAWLSFTGKHQVIFCQYPASDWDDSYLLLQAHLILASDSPGTSLIWLGSRESKHAILLLPLGREEKTFCHKYCPPADHFHIPSLIYPVIFFV